MARKIRTFSAALLCLFLFGHISGCATAQGPGPNQKASDYIVAARDCLFIVFTSEPFSVCIRREVDEQGEIILPHQVKLHIAGLTLAEVERTVQQQYPLRCFAWPLIVQASKAPR
jgi:hypothetical protein